MKKFYSLILFGLLGLSGPIDVNANAQKVREVSVVGGGIVGALESYYAYKQAQKDGVQIFVDVYEKCPSFGLSANGGPSTNTSYNIVPSLTIDEILSVVPRGSELIEKLSVLFSEPGGIRVDDVPGVNDSPSAIRFKEAVTVYGSDKDHDDRTLSLLTLGKKSMELWDQMYKEGDSELKAIFEASNFNPCREPQNFSAKKLRDGYRIDLIYDIANAKNRALGMKADYEKLGYKNCAVLSPDEVVAIDPFLADFCNEHSEMDPYMNRVWKNDAVALWRPGGCIDTRTFLPKFYTYLKKIMGQRKDESGQSEDCFKLHFASEVTGVIFDSEEQNPGIIGLKFGNGTQVLKQNSDIDSEYVFCTGESVGSLQKLGFKEPVYAGFAGPSLLLNIPLSEEEIESYKTFSHCMEVHKVGVVLAWQARFKENQIFIGVAGTKAFYGDKQPGEGEAFAKNRNLLQLNMVNNVLPEIISIACGYPTKGKTLGTEDLTALEEKGIARRWAGTRAVAYDGFPTIGSIYRNNQKVRNARCTTHLGSGGVSFGPGAVWASRSSKEDTRDPFVKKVLQYSDSGRSAKNN